MMTPPRRMILTLSAIGLSGQAVFAQTPTPQGPQAVQASSLLDLVPDDVWMALVLRDLNRIDQKFNAFQQQIDLNVPISVSWQVKSFLGVLEGMRPDGDIGLVLTSPRSSDPARDLGKDMVLFLPVSDQEAILRMLTAAPVEDGVYKGRMSGQEAYLTFKNGFALIGPERPLVEGVAASARSLQSVLSKPQLERFASDDLLLWVNLQALARSPSFDQLASRLAQSAGVNLRRLAGQRDWQLSLQLSPQGLRARAFSRSTSVSADGAEKGGSDLLMGLPEAGYVLAAGLATDGPFDVRPLTEQFLNALRLMKWIDDAQYETLHQFYQQVIGQTEAAGVCVSASDQAVLSVAKVLRTRSDAGALLTRIERITQYIRQNVAQDKREIDPFLKSVEYLKNQETVEGISVDWLRADLSLLKTLDVPVVLKVIGQEREGFLVRFAAVGDRRVILTLGGGREYFASVLAVVQAGQAPLARNPAIQAFDQTLPEKRWGECYLDVSRLARSADEIHERMGMTPMNLDFAQADVPIGVRLHAAPPDGREITLFVPVETIRAVKDALIESMTR